MRSRRPAADDGIFKAGKDRSEMWGASEVQEDENTKVEVPVDQRVAETVEEEVQDHEDANGGEAADEEGEAAEDIGHDHIPAEEIEDHSIQSHEVEPSHEKLNNYIEDVSHEAEVQEEDQHFNSADTHGENLEQINGDIYEKEEGEDEHPDENTDGKSQVEYSLPRPTSSRLLEKPSTPTETEQQDLEPEA